MKNLCVTCAVLLLGLGATMGMDDGSQAAAPFVLEEFLGQHWHHEAVTFPLTSEDRKAAEAGRPLRDEGGNPVAYQIIAADGNAPPQVLFQTDLKPFGRATFRFGTEKSAPLKTDLHVEETAGEIRLTNGQAGIAIRKKLIGGKGPIAGLRLQSGKWAGESSLEAVPALTSWTATVLEHGPVRARVACTGTTGDGGTLEMTFALLAGQPEILVDETSSLSGGSWMLSFAEQFRPRNLYYRSYPTNRGAVVTPSLEGRDGEVFQWVPWSPWWNREAGKWFGVYDDSDFLVLGVRDSEVWVDPALPAAARDFPKVVAKDGVVTVSFPLARGTRRWLIASVDRTASLAAANGKALAEAPLPQQSVIRQEFPLDRIKDLTLRWKGDEPHPHLLMTREKAEALRHEPPPAEKRPPPPVTIGNLDAFLQNFLHTGDPETGKILTDTAVQWMQDAVDAYFRQGSHYSFGFAPHHSQILVPLANLTDAMLGSGLLSEKETERLRAQAAFLGYTVSRPDFWSPERGFSANPNMSTFVAAYQVALGSLIFSHPEAKTWVQIGLANLKRQLDEWSDTNGGWLEAPHYAMASYHYLLGAFLMAANSGFENYVHDPKMKRVAEFFANITTPPDPRLLGRRHHPPIGNTYRFETSNQYGVLASVWKDSDPEFSANMQWMYQQQGNPERAGVGGSWPVMAGYEALFIDESLPARPPKYGSELFPETGVVLRNGYNTGNETMLYMIAGTHYQHYDYDSGSITLWGKGEPIADDFGYLGRAPIADHSMVETPYSDGLNMRILTFAPAKDADYVHGKLDGWDRQIFFLKDPDPLGPNYFFVADTMLGNAMSTWRLYLTGANITLGANNAEFSGDGKVDTQIQFLQPAEMDLTVEPRTHKIYGLDSEGRYGLHPVTLYALTARAKTRRFAALIYPRLKSQAPAKIEPLAEGRGAVVITDAGKDYIFLHNKSFHFQEDDLEFEGTAGVVRVRGKNGTLLLGDKGRISFGDHHLTSDKPASKSW